MKVLVIRDRNYLKHGKRARALRSLLKRGEIMGRSTYLRLREEALKRERAATNANFFDLMADGGEAER